MKIVVSRKRLALFCLIVLILILVGGAIYFFTSKKDLAEQSTYRAIFLANGQVYFGKADCLGCRYIDLTDVYYLQANQSLPTEKSTASADSAKASDLSLIKLGKELHGPTDQMKINRDQILFVETLRPDSKVVGAIADYQGKNR